MLPATIRIGFLGLLLCSFFSVAHAQVSKRLRIGAHLLQSIVVDVETDLNVTFVDEGLDTYVVKPELESDNQLLLSPATIRITGAPVEVMVDIEVEEVFDSGGEGEKILSISDFNLTREGAGSSVVIMPYSDEESFLLIIGGTVSGVEGFTEYYTGLNILNVNYL